MASKPSTTTAMTAIGKMVPPWKRTFLPLPREASLATFLADDDEATKKRGYRLRESKPDHGWPFNGGRCNPGREARASGRSKRVRQPLPPTGDREPPCRPGPSDRRSIAATRYGGRAHRRARR